MASVHTEQLRALTRAEWLLQQLSLLTSTKLKGVALIGLLMLLWEFAAIGGWVKAVSFPPMSSILSTWVTLLLNGELIGALAMSLQRMAVGYGLAIVLGVLLGLLMGYFSFFYNLL